MQADLRERHLMQAAINEGSVQLQCMQRVKVNACLCQSFA